MFKRFQQLVIKIAGDEQFGGQTAAHEPAMLVCAALLVVAEQLEDINGRMQSSFPEKY